MHYQFVAIDLIVQHIREFLNNRTRSDHSPHLATCGTSALNLANGRAQATTHSISPSMISSQLYAVLYEYS
uniref:Uncharacterized protein n=1 Tax=Anopheles coluzzii TaxID=1518534 RepID=A0A8W7PPQ5_ANOCL